MQYSAITYTCSFAEEWQRDVFEQLLCDAGVEMIDGDTAYLPTGTLEAHRADIEALFAQTEGVQLLSIEACEDSNWNAAWEAEHPVQELPLGVRIVPHCAFGAGHHETTSMLVEGLLSKDLSGQSVLDHGTGTGVLAIFAHRVGAGRVVAVDIDDKSVENAKENAVLNDATIDVRLGCEVPEELFDLILANIHRNVLLAHMSSYAKHLRVGGELWLSGFYEADCQPLIEEARKNGLALVAQHHTGEWYMLQLKKEEY